jgi:hypothetical protein
LLSERLYKLANAPGVVAFMVNYPTLEGDMIDAIQGMPFIRPESGRVLFPL